MFVYGEKLSHLEFLIGYYLRVVQQQHPISKHKDHQMFQESHRHWLYACVVYVQRDYIEGLWPVR